MIDPYVASSALQAAEVGPLRRMLSEMYPELPSDDVMRVVRRVYEVEADEVPRMLAAATSTLPTDAQILGYARWRDTNPRLARNDVISLFFVRRFEDAALKYPEILEVPEDGDAR